MNPQLFQTFKNWFTEYVNGFKNQEKFREGIEIKEVHSLKVYEAAMGIARSLQLPSRDLNLAGATALFHDIGRFEQYARYFTYVDMKSVNHAELGVEVIQRYKLEEKLPEEDRSVFIDAVKFHNRAELPNDLTERENLHCRIVRDADKLDIWRVVTEYYKEKEMFGKNCQSIELELDDSPEFSDAVLDELMDHHYVTSKNIRNLNDFKLAQIGWIYDLNFPHSFQQLKEKCFLEKIFHALNGNNPRLEDIKKELFSYLNSKLKPSS
jgi:putative nucleotidyltransferase with HDIG domain